MKKLFAPLQPAGGNEAGSAPAPGSDRGLAGGVSRPTPGSVEAGTAAGGAERPASPYAAGSGTAAGPSADPEEEKRTIRDGMDTAEVRRILQEFGRETVIYWHDGGRFELTGAELAEAPIEGMEQLPFGAFVICAEKVRGIL